jgi:type IV pilus assembly protein PilB
MREINRRQLLPHSRLCKLWGDSLHKAYVNPSEVQLPSGEGKQLPRKVATIAQAIVLHTLEDAATVGMADPTNDRLVSSFQKILGREVSSVFSHPDDIAAVIDLHFTNEKTLAASLQKACDDLPTLDSGREIETEEDAADLLQGESFNELFNSIIFTSFGRKASDIHFETDIAEGRVRMRIDGKMNQIINLPRLIYNAMIVRVKVLSSLNISESRLPQDGAFEIQFGGKRLAFRVSTMPTIYGEKAVLRLLGAPGQQAQPRISTVGLAYSIRQGLERGIKRPNGIIFVCGPTGSGKTTTLYSCLAELNKPDVNITTLEDPVEIRLPSITQHQVNQGIGLTFERLLRGVLRQDPDVVLVGEIRDGETATIATEAALTGHLVLSSLHTNDSIQAITRLLELGVAAHMVAPTVIGILSQRLVRRICSACKESYTPSPSELAPFFHNPDATEIVLYRGRGCPHCYGTGFSGRAGVHEYLEISEDMRDLITARAEPAKLAAEAKKSGYRPMRYDGLLKALHGWTTLEEVEKATLPEIRYR